MQGESDSRRRRHALLIEDNPVEARFLQRMLTSRGDGNDSSPPYQVQGAESLADGLRLLQETVFDVVLLDLNLPDSRGLETLGRLQEAGHHVPVVVLTAQSDEGQALLAVQQGAQDFLDKGTVNSKLLLRVMGYAMERHKLLEDVRSLAEAAAARDRQSRSVITAMQSGFERLAAGDLAVRVGKETMDGVATEDLSQLLISFDGTMSQLQAAAEMREQFHSMAAHDTRAPLGSLRLAIETLAKEGLPVDKQDLMFGIMRRQVRKLIGLMDSMLDYFVITSGGTSLTLESLDLNEILIDCSRDLARQAGERNQTLEAEPLPGGAQVTCDRMKVVRVLDNLVGNAIKYSRDGDSIRMAVCRDGEDAFRIEIQDNGPGLPAEEVGRVFDRFHRVPGPDRRIQGTGLGLAICEDYVKAHGGRIWVESIEGEGCKFCFILPSLPPA